MQPYSSPFSDDILLFVEDNDEYISNLRNVIFLLEAAGLNINLSKSPISPINVNNSRIEAVANLWGSQKQFLPINYLGKPSFISFLG